MIASYYIALPGRKKKKEKEAPEAKTWICPRKRHSSPLFPPYVQERPRDDTRRLSRAALHASTTTSLGHRLNRKVTPGHRSLRAGRAELPYPTPAASLADLYDPRTIPPELVKAHRKLDDAVDAAYSKKKFLGDSDRVASLF